MLIKRNKKGKGRETDCVKAEGKKAHFEEIVEVRSQNTRVIKWSNALKC